MTNLKLGGTLALASGLLMAATLAGRAQFAATLNDIGAAPVPGAYDQSQLLCRPTAGSPPGLNYYWDNSAPPGTTFTTGPNAGGYILSTLAFQTLGGGGSPASQPYVLRLYSVSGAGNTTATLLGSFTSQSFQAVTSGNDWLQMSGLSLALQPNTIYAYTFGRGGSSGYVNLGNTNGNPYPGGEACAIPPAGGAITYTTTATYDATFDIGLTLPTALTVNPPVASANPITSGLTATLTAGTVVDNAGNGMYTYQWQTDGGSGGTLTNIPNATSATLTVNTTGLNLGVYQYQVVVTDSTLASVTSSPLALSVTEILSGTLVDAGTTAPVPGGYDIAQLVGGSSAYGGLNYYDNNGTPAGQTFTTGSNLKGYGMSSLALQMAGGSSGTTGPANYSGYDLFIYVVATSGTAYLLADITNLNFAFTYGHWLQWTFPTINLSANEQYAYTFHRRGSGYAGLSTDTGGSDLYPGGQIGLIPTGGGTVIYGNNGNSDGTFDIGLVPLGVSLVLNNPTATPNPVYALSPVVLHDTVQLPATGSFTYKWLTDDGSGATPPNYITIPGATSTNLTVIPQDLTPGGSPYTTNYYFVASVGNSSATSAPVVLTVNAASEAQFITTPTPTNLVTFAGQNMLNYSVSEAGTTPITNQWQFNNGSGFANLTGQTNPTLVLSNLLTSQSGIYQVGAANVLGLSNSPTATLTVNPAPANPAASELFAYRVLTNHPWAYWRLNETNDPTAANAPTYTAYDFSGHGYDPVYGTAVTVSNAGPQSPAYPGFSATELAANTLPATGGSLTVPALNLAGQTNLTFMAWIYPNGTQAGAAGLLFNRGGPDNACGFGFGNTADHLGYTWNNNALATWSWESELAVAEYQWNFVAYVITPTNTTVYLGNTANGTTNFLQSVNSVANIGETFAGGTILLGGDQNSVGRTFYGSMCEAGLLTNSLSTAQVQQYFLAGLGAATLPPAITAVAVIPASTVYSGQNVLLEASVSGTAPLTNAWQTSTDELTWTTIPGANGSTLVANPQYVGTVYYQFILSGAGGAVTNGPIPVTYQPLPTTPAGLWTANFQETNNIGAGQTAGGGVGHYVGRGILGNGMYWNILPHILPAGGEYGANTLFSVSDLLDDGATHSGIYCQMNNGGSYNALGGSLANSADIGNLLDQFYRTYYSAAADGAGALQFFGVPAGTYNLVCYSGDGVTSQGAANLGSTFTVYDPVNGNQTQSAADTTGGEQALEEGVNFVLFTNVHINGELNVDVLANPATGASAIIEGAQLQLVSYDSPAPSVPLNSSVTGSSLTLTWSQGLLQTATNLLGPWTFIYGPSPVTVPIVHTNFTQFYRVKVQ
jgi:hypothetical protein